jgi:outer membrane protein insertion porin family
VDWYTPIVQNLVFKAKAGYGFLGFFNNDIGPAPFERFYLGGSGLTGFQLDGREIIALRGYDDGSVSPLTGGTSIAKYTAELRYPLSLNPSATIYMLAFAEAGNTWNDFSNFQPFNVNKSAGVGVRIFLPMFGLLGLDWGYRLDDISSRPGMQQSQIHFTIGANLGQL